MIHELKEFGVDVDVYDPWADKAEVKHEYGIGMVESFKYSNYEAIILAVAHHQFKTLDLHKTDKCVLFDIKSFIDSKNVDGRL